jgi:hypothetical protein
MNNNNVTRLPTPRADKVDALFDAVRKIRAFTYVAQQRPRTEQVGATDIELSIQKLADDAITEFNQG